jgi:metallo-beta-lactamase family protein
MGWPENSLRFLGGTETVTGSRYLIELGQTRILVDCGLFQGFKNLRERNWKEFPVPADTIDYVILSHAHLDHSGYVPALVAQGFQGQVFVTSGTSELVQTLWPDSAHLLEEEAERSNRKGYTKHSPAKPLYSQSDVEHALARLSQVHFGKKIELTKAASFEFLHAGHILGAAQIRLEINGQSIHFTGDLGRDNDPLMLPPDAYSGSDILITESTYGGKKHPEIDPEDELALPLGRVLGRGGTVVIPAFAVGRTQALLLHIWRLMQSGRIPRVPIFVNSPMARSATASYEKHQEEHRVSPAEFDEIYSFAHMVNSVEESKKLNMNRSSKIIIAASGMMSGGRVLHHLVEFGQDPNNGIVITGYQAGGTRGRKLQDGADAIRIFGRDVPIRAEIFSIESMSAHADGVQIVDWIGKSESPPKIIYITHGEPESSEELRLRIKHQLGLEAMVPKDGEVIDLDAPI